MAVIVDNLDIGNRVLLAPMSGITDLPFRTQAKRLGAGLVICEMTASRELVRGRADMVRKIAASAVAGPLAVQLAGREPRWMAQAAKLAQDAGARLIDINMGCPSRQVTCEAAGGATGSALMRDPDLALRLIEAVRGAVQLPVSVKMRLGWDDQSLNAPLLARRAEAAGAVMIAVHGRTRCQFYKGRADWEKVGDTVRAVRVPVVVNGDILSLADAREALAQSGAAAVMVGRGACGRPWLPGQIARALEGSDSGQALEGPSLKTHFALLAEQFDHALRLYGKPLGVRLFRKHLAWSLEAAPLRMGAAAERALRARACRLDDAGAVFELIHTLGLNGAARLAA